MPNPDKKPYFSLSVHSLVDFLLRKGDIDNRIYNSETMALGSKMHSSFQQKQGNEYLSEVSLKKTFVRPQGTIALEGRADGIIIGGNYPIIDEIKTTVDDLEHFAESQREWHEGQAFCYALMYAHEHHQDKMAIRLTYLSQTDSKKKLVREKLYFIEEIEQRVYSIMDDYLSFFSGEIDREKVRNLSSKNLPFPYPSFRNGQREMAKYAYGTFSKGGIFFAEAPTGIGKTVSCLYPAIKSFSKGKTRKIFYLTAKNSGSQSAFSLMGLFYEDGLVARDISLLSKEKMCANKGKACNPDECPFAKDYYTKLKGVIEEAFASGARFSPDYVRYLAILKGMCPFELQLDLSSFCDVIIGDYNYFFDPLVRLERFFESGEEKKDYVVLVDEAHNLIDRGRGMHSEAISLKAVKEAKKSLKGTRARKIISYMSTLISFLEEGEGFMNEAPFCDLASLPQNIAKLGEKIKDAERDRSKKENTVPLSEEYKEFSRTIYRFFFLYANYGDDVVLFYEKKGDDILLRLYCLDPSPMLQARFAEVDSKVVFSATLSPMNYYIRSLTGEDKAPYLILPSPFPTENLSLTIAKDVSIRYKDREGSYSRVAEYLKSFVKMKKGNYFLYFPSYEYLEKIRPLLIFEDAEVFVQHRDMDEKSKERFLEKFLVGENEKSLVALLVIGGSYSEGVDLPLDKLIGVAIVGVGLPSISHEGELIREHFASLGEDGFSFAYRYPALNKVMQAIGRLIRTEKDTGAVLLLDDRYLSHQYREIISLRYPQYNVADSPEEVENILKDFYTNLANKV